MFGLDGRYGAQMVCIPACEFSVRQAYDDRDPEIWRPETARKSQYQTLLSSSTKIAHEQLVVTY